MISLVKLITEVSIDQLRRDWVDSGKVSPEFFDSICRCTNYKSAYTTWLLKRIYEDETSRIIWEDHSKKYSMEDAEQSWQKIFKDFEKYKPYMRIKDINRFNSIRRFIVYVKEAEQKYIEHQNEKNVNQFKIGTVKADDKVYEVYKLPEGCEENRSFSVILGRHSKNCHGWCTAYDGETDYDYWEEYINKGDLYIFRNPENPSEDKFQLQYESNNARLVPVTTDKPLNDIASLKFYPFYEFLHEKENRPIPSFVKNANIREFEDTPTRYYEDYNGIYVINKSDLEQSLSFWGKPLCKILHLPVTSENVIKIKNGINFDDIQDQRIFFVSTTPAGSCEDTRIFAISDHSDFFSGIFSLYRIYDRTDILRKFVINPEKDNQNPVFLKRVINLYKQKQSYFPEMKIDDTVKDLFSSYYNLKNHD